MIGMCPALPSNEGNPVGTLPSSVALTDDGGPSVPGAPLATDTCHPVASTSMPPASLIAQRKETSFANDSCNRCQPSGLVQRPGPAPTPKTCNAAASASPSIDGHFYQPLKDKLYTGLPPIPRSSTTCPRRWAQRPLACRHEAARHRHG